MASVVDHYETLLADHYTWMFGDHAAKTAEQTTLFKTLDISPHGSGRALDLGCGSGFQAMALASLGFQVRAVDLSHKLLDELNGLKGSFDIETVRADMRSVAELALPGTELITCMGDTLTHLDSRDDVERFFHEIHQALEPGGSVLITYRDLSVELTALDRFIPVRQSEDVMMTCFLEYEPQTVKVHDLIHVRRYKGWELHKSSYQKLRLAANDVAAMLTSAGFVVQQSNAGGGLVALLANK